ncbi:MAG TPA: hypothetical protein PLA50_14590, partial [Bacteroidia bacterium]|nr:hypothetical protein [Bacteroidia bacterium]
MARKSAKSAKPAADGDLLVNQLTVRDAAHLVKTEGGSLSTGQIAVRLSVLVLVAAFTARAIVLGHATVWHLFLPLVAEYLVLLLSLPVLTFFVRDGELRKEAR